MTQPFFCRNLSVADWSEFGLWTGASPRCLRNNSLGLLWVIQCVLEHFRVHGCTVMAFKEVFVLFAFLFCSTSACTYDNNCASDESCCWDGVCREKCSGCTFNYECGTNECCDPDGYCYDCSVLKTPAIVGIVFGCLVVTAIVISIAACFCCACCPYYRYRHPGTVIVGAPATGYQQFVTTTSTQQTIPPPVPQGYAAQPPPYYPPQQAGPYPPPQAQGMAQYPPPQAKGP